MYNNKHLREHLRLVGEIDLKYREITLHFVKLFDALVAIIQKWERYQTLLRSSLVGYKRCIVKAHEISILPKAIPASSLGYETPIHELESVNTEQAASWGVLREFGDIKMRSLTKNMERMQTIYDSIASNIKSFETLNIKFEKMKAKAEKFLSSKQLQQRSANTSALENVFPTPTEIGEWVVQICDMYLKELPAKNNLVRRAMKKEYLESWNPKREADMQAILSEIQDEHSIDNEFIASCSQKIAYAREFFTPPDPSEVS